MGRARADDALGGRHRGRAPAFAIGRTQELMLVAEANDLTPYVDGMGVEVTRLVRRHPEFLRDPEALRRATGARAS